MRETILGILNDAYSMGSGNTFATALNEQLADDLMEMLKAEPSRDQFIDRIWAYWSGGETAEAVAEKIISRLGLTLPD